MSTTSERLSAALAGRYRIQRELGAGGMATVYLAEDLKHDRKVAIKVLKPELAAVLGAERFVVEIKTTAAMSHPHVLPLFDSGTADGFLFYVMPYIEGETIREKLNRETQFGVDEAVRIAREVADALDYAHRHGVIHRDIKPENILLHDGRAMVMDFGIALAVSAAAGGRMTETGLSLGTPHYMSPEQATAEKEITPRSDVYSLASVLYEMLAGEPPHTAGSAQAVIMKIVTDNARPVNELRRNVPPNVVAALAKALEKLPADRFEGAKSFADALANPSFHGDATSVAATAALRMSRWRAVGVPLGAAALGAAAVGAGFIAARPAPPPAMRIAIALPEDQRILSGLLSLSLSADGQSFAYISTDERILVKESRAARARTIADDARGASPILAPDASAVAYVTANPGNLVVAPLSGGEVRTLMRDSVQPSAGAWTASGWIYFSTVGAIMRTRPDGNRMETLARVDSGAGETRFYGVEPLPGERAMLAWVGRRGQSADIVAIEMGSGRRHALGQGAFARYLAPGYLLVVQDDGRATLAGFDRSTLTVTGVLRDLPFRVGSRAGRGLTIAAAADGTLMYEAPGEQFGPVVRVTRDGSASVLDPAWRDTVREVRLSPDERQLAYRRITRGVQAIWVRELQTGRATLVHRGGGNAYRPEWSSDGRTLRFIDVAPNGVAQVMERAIGSAAPAQVIATSPRGVDEASFSRDGRWMVARVGVAGNRDIAAMRLGTDSMLKPIIATRAEELSPALSADASMLAYVSDETGRREVWIAPFPNVDSGRRMVSLAGGTEPAWSPDGNELFFKSGDSLQSVTATPGRSGIELTTPRALFSTAKYFADFNHATYAVARGAKTFYMTQEPGGVGERLMLERGWLLEFITGARR